MQLDSNYYRKRADSERQASATATSKAAAEVHRLMAEEYLRRATQAAAARPDCNA